MERVGSVPGAAEARESAFWRTILNAFLKSTPTPIMRFVRRRVPAVPIEEFSIVGRGTGRERHLLIGLFDVDGRWYAGNPSGTSKWVRNLIAAGDCVVTRRDGIPTRVLATELEPGPERDAAIAAACRQPAPAGVIYRRARRHIQAAGHYFRLTPAPA